MGIGINQQKVCVMVDEIDTGRCPCSALGTSEVKTKGYHLTMTRNDFGIYHACLVKILSIDVSDVPVEYL